MSPSLLEVVQHYQKKIEKYNDEDKILHCFDKLRRLPITLDILSETGVGKTVNAFRRDPGLVGNKSRELVSKWKRIFDESEKRASQRPASPRSPQGGDEDEDEDEDEASDGMQIDETVDDQEEVEPERERRRPVEENTRKETEGKRRDDEKHRRKEKKKGDHSSGEKEHRKHRRSKEEAEGGEGRHRKEGKHKQRHEHERQSGEEPLTNGHTTAAEINGDVRHHSKHSSSKVRSSNGHSSREDVSASGSSKGHGSSPSSKEKTGKCDKQKDTKQNVVLVSESSDIQSRPESSKDSSSRKSDKKKSSKSSSPDSHGTKEKRHSSHRHKTSRSERADEGGGSAESGTRPAAAATLREADFLCQAGSSAGSQDAFANALGELDTVSPKKRKKEKKKSSAASTTSATASQSAVADLPPPPSSPPRIDLTSALPEISTHYRPLPTPRSPPHGRATAAKRSLDEEQALAAVLNAKNKRTKVYSGARTGWSRVPSLVEVCLRSLQENIDYLEYTGGVPYEILRPVLERCTAEQLQTIEYYNSYLMEDTDDLWRALVNKEFKTERRQEMETWREMYTRCSEERETKLSKLRSLIEGKRKETLACSRKTKVAYEHTVAKPPRNVARKQAKHGTAVAANMPVPGLNGVPRSTRPSPGTDPTARPASAPPRSAPQAKKKAPLMAKVLRTIGRR